MEETVYLQRNQQDGRGMNEEAEEEERKNALGGEQEV